MRVIFSGSEDPRRGQGGVEMTWRCAVCVWFVAMRVHLTCPRGAVKSRSKPDLLMPPRQPVQAGLTAGVLLNSVYVGQNNGERHCHF